MSKYKIIPITLSQANNFVIENHRHHKNVTGCKFCIGLVDYNKEIINYGDLIGIAIGSRPVNRYLDNGFTLEISRLCMKEDNKNGCSMLYSACYRIAKHMGYEKICTYILESESGISLYASGFYLAEITKGNEWINSFKSDIKHNNNFPICNKKRFEKIIPRGH
jgi:hypothetical protein